MLQFLRERKLQRKNLRSFEYSHSLFCLLRMLKKEIISVAVVLFWNGIACRCLWYLRWIVDWLKLLKEKQFIVFIEICKSWEKFNKLIQLKLLIQGVRVNCSKCICSNLDCSTVFSKMSSAWQKNVICLTEKRHLLDRKKYAVRVPRVNFEQFMKKSATAQQCQAVDTQFIATVKYKSSIFVI
jgi:hypothetical protein